MAQNRYAISTTGIADGDLVVFIANIDNGSNDLWMLPPGFTKLYQLFYNGGDGQTFVAGYKIVGHATDEGLSYTEPYGPGVASGCAVVMVIAITGYDPTNPFDDTTMTAGVTADNPVVLRSQVTTTRPNDRLILAGGADWLSGYGSNAQSGNTSFDPPTNFDLVDGISDSGGAGFTWTSQLIATRVAATAGPTGLEDGHMLAMPQITGTPWTIELAIAPAP